MYQRPTNYNSTLSSKKLHHKITCIYYSQIFHELARLLKTIATPVSYCRDEILPNHCLTCISYNNSKSNGTWSPLHRFKTDTNWR